MNNNQKIYNKLLNMHKEGYSLKFLNKYFFESMQLGDMNKICEYVFRQLSLSKIVTFDKNGNRKVRYPNNIVFRKTNSNIQKENNEFLLKQLNNYLNNNNNKGEKTMSTNNVIKYNTYKRIVRKIIFNAIKQKINNNKISNIKINVFLKKVIKRVINDDTIWYGDDYDYSYHLEHLEKQVIINNVIKMHEHIANKCDYDCEYCEDNECEDCNEYDTQYDCY